MGQYIFGRYADSAFSVSDGGKKYLKSSFGSVVSDFVGESSPSKAGPILCSFEAVPIAFWRVPTLNRMVFSRVLWENLLANDYLRRTMEDGAHFGEASHADRDEVLLKETACRVNKFWLSDQNNWVLGNVDLLNTPNGNIIYTLARVGRVGISSRGFGELADRDDGLREVVPDQYAHVCWDMVAFPAVPDASMTLRSGEDALSSIEMSKMSDDLRGLIKEAYEIYPDSKPLKKLFSRAYPDVKKSFVIDSKFRRELGNAIFAHNLRNTDLFSGKKRAILSARETILSRIKFLEAKLKELYPGFTWSRVEASASIDGNGSVVSIEVSYRLLYKEGRFSVLVVLRAGEKPEIRFGGSYGGK